MTIFKAYDVRGQYPDDINEEIAYTIGRAFVTFTKTKDVMVGIDARTHSPSLADAFAKGCTDQGADVTDVGLITTSQMIALRSWQGHDAAVMVTASHLDAPMNGFKMLTGTGQYISENYGMADLRALVEQDTFVTPQAKGTLRKADYLDAYVKKLLTLQPLPAITQPFVVDCSNGSSGPEMQAIKAKTGLPFVIINAEPDGTFPNHSPNPIAPGAGDQASAAVKEHKALGGCILDADADRVTFIDETGAIIHPNAIACLLAEQLAAAGDTVVYDLISSRVVPETIAAQGAKPLRSKVGRANIIAVMMANDSVLGLESSSHYMFRDTSYGEATSFTLLLVLRAIERSGKALSELVAPFIGKYALLNETNYRVPDADKAIEAVEVACSDADRDYLDGVTLTWEDGWVVARKSNTEPLLRIRAEADSAKRLAELKQRIEAVIVEQGGSPHTSSH